MKLTPTLFAFVLALMLAPLAHAQYLPDAQPGGSNSNQPQTIDRIVAVVEEQLILQSELDDAVQSVKQQYASDPQKLPPPNVLRKQVLDRLILMRLQVQHAQEQGIHVSQKDVSQAITNIAANNQMSADQLRQAVASKGGSFAEFQQNVGEQVLVQKLRDQTVQSQVQVTDAEVDNLLKDPTFSNTKVHVAHIDINLPNGATPQDISAAQTRANEAEKAIHGGMDFNAAAIRYSGAQDALDGGDLGWRDISETPPAFAQIIAKMKPGQVTPPLRGPSGFHIIKLIGRRADKPDVVTQYHARQILIKSSELLTPEQAQQKAQGIYQQITQKKADFAKLAKKDSDDDTTANIGGDLGWFQLPEHGPAIAKVISSLSDGEVSKPFKTPVGWDIIKRLATRQQDVTSQALRNRARQAIGTRKAKQAYQSFLRDLRSGAYINIRVPSLRESSDQPSQS